MSKNDKKIDSPPECLSQAAKLYWDSVEQVSDMGIYQMPDHRMFNIWEEVSEDFMENGWISSEDISWLTPADLKRCRHYDNLVVYDEEVAIAKAADDLDDFWDNDGVMSYEEMEQRDNAHLDNAGAHPFGLSGWGCP